MRIGIVGYGKMGRDIFSLLFDKIREATFVVYDIAGNEEENTKEVNKTLEKSLKRKKLTNAEYELKKTNFKFTSDLNDFKLCNIIIEAIYEDMAAKKELFAKLEKIANPLCLFATNTSSLDIAEIFSDIEVKKRCMGIHFFYPVKLTGFVEFNILPETASIFIRDTSPIILGCGKTPITFSGQYHMYLNQILACMVSHAIRLTEELDVSPAELDKALSGIFSVAGPFEVLDSVSLGLMAGSPESFLIERNKALLSYGFEKMNGWLAQGCPKESGKFLDFAAENIPATGKSTDSAELSMIAMILNETVNASIESGMKNILADAIQDTLGLSKSPADYYKEFGAETIFAELDRLSSAYGCGTYVHKDKAAWDKILG